MILNKADFIHFRNELNPWNRYSVWRMPWNWRWRMSLIRAIIADYLFNGGTICNKHDKYYCNICGREEYAERER